MIFTRMFLIVYTMCVCLLLQCQATDQPMVKSAEREKSPLGTRIVTINVKDETMAEFVLKLYSVEIPVMLETLNGKQKKITFSFQNVKLREVLKKACDDSDYAFVENEGLINIFPAEAVKLGDKYPLNKRVVSLQTQAESVPRLIELLEKNSGADILLLEISNEGEHAKVALKIKDLSVRQALNQITQKAGLTSWGASTAPIRDGSGKESLLTTVIMR